MPLTVEQLIANVDESGLMTADAVRQLIRELPPEKQNPSPEDLARELARQGKLTPFQATQIYNGRQASLHYGNYVVLDKLGEGGMGMVFKAQHRVMQRTVALKVLSPKVTKDPTALKRFHREVQASAQLTHPNIVTAFDADQARNIHFLVMEYVEGKDLSAFVKKHGPLSIEQAVDCILQAARGLEFAHSKGIVHRDIKPSNLLLDSHGNVKILDMGLARFQMEGAEAELTHTGAAMGTIDYMSPEQALDSKHADHRADIYSLGISLWFLLTRRPAYDGSTLMAKLLAHRENPIPDLRSCRDDVSDGLNHLFQRMVAKKPEARYQSMAEVIRDLEAIRSGGSASASTPQPVLAAGSGGESAMNAFLAGLEQSPAGALKSAAPAAGVKIATLASAADDTNTSTRHQATFSQISRLQTHVTERFAQVVQVVPPRWRPFALAGAGAAALFLLGAVTLFLRVGKVDVQVIIDDPALAVRFDGETVTFEGSGAPIRLKPGDRKFIVERDGLEVTTDSFLVKKEGKNVLHVSTVDGKVTVLKQAASGQRQASGGRKPPDSSQASTSTPPAEASPASETARTELPQGGWHDWPADAPPPAIAPFDAEHAKKHQEAWAAYLKVPVEYTNSIGMEFRLIPPGEFMMGSTPEEINEFDNLFPESVPYQEQVKSGGPRHRVILSRPFYLGVHEVTQRQYETVMGSCESCDSTSKPSATRSYCGR